MDCRRLSCDCRRKSASNRRWRSSCCSSNVPRPQLSIDARRAGCRKSSATFSGVLARDDTVSVEAASAAAYCARARRSCSSSVEYSVDTTGMGTPALAAKRTTAPSFFVCESTHHTTTPTVAVQSQTEPRERKWSCLAVFSWWRPTGGAARLGV